MLLLLIVQACSSSSTAEGWRGTVDDGKRAFSAIEVVGKGRKAPWGGGLGGGGRRRPRDADG